MGKRANMTRMSARLEGLNQAHRRLRDRALLFQAYEQAKQRELAARVDGGMPASESAAKPVVAVYGVQEDETPRKKLFCEIPRIEDERIVLDRVVDADADALRDLIENPKVQRYLPTYLFEKQFGDAHEAISQLYGDLFENRESLILAIRVKEGGELAGLGEFYSLRDSLHKISMGYRLRECWWGHGLATEAARLMVGYLYGETDIEIITASTMIENEASTHVLEKADFIRTARSVEEDWGFPELTIVDKWFC